MGNTDEGDGRQPGDDVLYRRTTRWFRKAMLAKLRQHAVKGPWATMSCPYLFKRAQEEMAELRAAMANGASQAAVLAECADVANLLMMLADNWGAGEAPEPEPGRPDHADCPCYSPPPQAKPAPSAGHKYHRTIKTVNKGGVPIVDVYCVLEAFRVTCPARAHAVKKLLCAGLRGKGDALQDLSEAAVAVSRAIQLEAQRQAEAKEALDDSQ